MKMLARFAVLLAEHGASEILLAHLSRGEQHPPLWLHQAVETALSAAGLCPALSVAPRDTMSVAHPCAGGLYAESKRDLRGKASRRSSTPELRRNTPNG